MRDRNLFLCLLFSILFLITNFIYSEQPHQQKITILLSTQTLDNTDLYSFEDIINDSISFELKVDGFGIIINKNTRSTEVLLQSAVRQGASFLIKSRYSTDESFLELSLDCIRATDGVILHSTSKESKMDLDLDSFIRKAAMEIIALIKEDIKNNPPLILKSVEKVELSKEEKIETDTEDEAIGQVDDSVEVSHTPDRVPVILPADFRNFTISTGFIPFMTTGKASNYFTYGMGPDLYTGYNFQTPFGYFGLGIYSSLIYFAAEGLLISSENLLISAGPEIRLGVDTNSFLGIFLRVNGGVTLFMMNRNNEGYQSAVIPFASGGMGLTMNITSILGIAVSTNYSLYIENSILITGFSPSAGIDLKL